MTSLLEKHRSDTQHKLLIDDVHEAVLTNPDIQTVDDAYRAFFTSQPTWVVNLLRFRNKVLGWVGFTGVDTTDTEFPEVAEPGQSVGVFGVLDRTDDEILMGGDDNHFSMRISIELRNDEEPPLVRVATIAYGTDAIGKAYLSFVRYPHGPIARMTANRIAGG